MLTRLACDQLHWQVGIALGSILKRSRAGQSKGVYFVKDRLGLRKDLPAKSLKETAIIDHCKAKVDALGDWLYFEFGPHEMYERQYDCKIYTEPCGNYARKLNYLTSVKSEAAPEPVPLK